jgi:hypothetical protein
MDDNQPIESAPYDGEGVIRIYLPPEASPDAAVTEVAGISEALLRQIPPGSVPPLVIEYNESNENAPTW